MHQHPAIEEGGPVGPDGSVGPSLSRNLPKLARSLLSAPSVGARGPVLRLPGPPAWLSRGTDSRMRLVQVNACKDARRSELEFGDAHDPAPVGLVGQHTPESVFCLLSIGEPLHRPLRFIADEAVELWPQ